MGKKIDAKAAFSTPMRDKRVILFMVVRGFGMFLLVTGMVGIAFVSGPLNHILGVETATIYGNTALDFLLCFLLSIIGGTIDFVGDAFVKQLSA